MSDPKKKKPPPPPPKKNADSASAPPPVAKKPPPPKAKKAGGWEQLTTEDGLIYYYNAEKNLTQEEKPEELKTLSDREDQGDWVWLPDEQEGYVPAKVLSRDASRTITEVQAESGRRFKLNKKSVQQLIPMNKSALRKVDDDLVQMDYIDEGTIIHNLRQRFKKDTIYTNIGTILIIVNPYKWLKLYTPEIMEKYRNKGTQILAPHIFDIADAAYRDMSDRLSAGTPPNQSILISGESGAGKTEATKQALKYMAHIAGSVGNVEERLLGANPVLESFGNAATLRNYNSSRFGKWMEVFFDDKRCIAGAKINNYLLEKTRVTHQDAGERNYHIFYQLCLDPKIAAKYQLSSAHDFRYIRTQVEIGAAHWDDRREFAEVCEAMDKLGFESEKDDLFRLVAGLLHIGNINLATGPDDRSYVSNKDQLEIVAHLLQVPADEIELAIIKRTLVMKGQENVIVPLTANQAAANRDALVKTLYATMFNWLVQRINRSIAPPPGSEPVAVIGVLDIFGFEIFKTNSFEQLCINYTNEKLQQHFNRHTFKEEQLLYEAEQIDFEAVTFIDNQPCLDLLELKPNGILCVLDEEAQMVNGSDKRFVDKCNTKHRDKTERYVKNVLKENAFGVYHYAGEVIYSGDGMLDKNKDTVEEDLLILIRQSKFQFLQTLFRGETGGAKDRKKSIANQFTQQLNALMNELNATHPHYVRCIKPNAVKRPQVFDGHDSLLQLRYAGVFEAVQIRKKGYPFRYHHGEFVKRYGVFNHFRTLDTDRDTCVDILRSLKGMDFGEIQIGLTRVLYRAASHRMLEMARATEHRKRALRVQACFRGHRARKLYKKMRRVYDLLRTAMEGRNLDALKAAIAEAKTMWFQLRKTKEAEAFIKVLEEEKRVVLVLESLLNVDAEANYDAIIGAVRRAEALGMTSPLMGKLMSNVREIHERKQAAVDLREGAKNFNRKQIEDGIAVATRLSLPLESEIARAREALKRIEREEELVAELMALLKKAGPDDTDKLQKAVEKANSFGVKTEGGREMVSKLTVTLDIRKAIQDKNWDGLKAAVKRAEDLGLGKLSDVAAAHEGLRTREQMEKVAAQLHHAVAAKDASRMRKELDKAGGLAMASSPWSSWADEVKAAQDMLHKHERIIRSLESALEPAKAKHVEAMAGTVREAQAYGFLMEADREVVRRAEVLLAVRVARRDKDWEGLQKAVDDSEGAGLGENAEVVEARAGLELRATMKLVAAYLKESAECRDAEGMQEGLKEAEKHNMKESPWSTWQEEVTQAEEQLARHQAVSAAIRDAMAPGTEKSTEPLKAAIAAAKVYGFQMEPDMVLLAEASAILRLRTLLLGKDWANLPSAVEQCTAASLTEHKEVRTVKRGLALRETMLLVANYLTESNTARDRDGLKEGLAKAEELHMEESYWSSWQSVVADARGVLAHHDLIMRGLDASLELPKEGVSLETEDLEGVLREAKAFAFTLDEDLKVCREAHVALKMRRFIAERGWKALEAFVARCDEAGFTSEELGRVKEILALRAKMQEVAEEIARHVGARDFDAVADAMERATALGATTSPYSSWVETLKEAQGLVAQHEHIMLALETAIGPGDHSKIPSLQAAYDAAEKFGLKTEADLLVLDLASMVLEVREAVDARDYDTVGRVLREIDALGKAAQAALDEKEFAAVRQGMALRAHMAPVAADLRVAIQTRDSTALTRLLKDAKEQHMEVSPWSTWGPLVAEATQAKNKHLNLFGSLTRALDAGKVSQLELERILKEAEAFGFTLDRDIELLDQVQIMFTVRQALESESWDKLQTALTVAKDAGMESEELMLATHALETYHRRLKQKSVLSAVMDARTEDAVALSSALQEAESLGMFSDKHFSGAASDAKEMQSKIERCRVLITDGTQQRSEEMLAEALELAKEMNYPSVIKTEVADARIIWRKFKGVREAAEAALAAGDIEGLQKVLYRAGSLGMRGGILDHVNARLPGLVYASSKLRLECFEGLRRPEDFAGRLGPRYAATMLVWDTEPIPTSLSSLTSALQVRKATDAFSELLVFLGHRAPGGGQFNSATMKAGNAAIGRELIALGRDGLADEMYLQLLKQLTRNQDRQSAGIGWRLLEGYVRSFVPSRGFLPHLEFYLANCPEVEWRATSLALLDVLKQSG